MPIIFASSMLLLPQVIYRFFGTQISNRFQNFGQALKYASESWLNQQTSIYYVLLSFILIVLFSIFYITIIMKPDDVGDDLRRRNSFIPGVRPGKETIDYISTVVLRIGFWGGLVLALISSLPYIFGIYNTQQTTGLEYFIAGGTSILIVVPTILAIKMQLDALVLTKNYEQFEEI
jgi:preprotein translocase subunit SecY